MGQVSFFNVKAICDDLDSFNVFTPSLQPSSLVIVSDSFVYSRLLLHIGLSCEAKTAVSSAQVAVEVSRVVRRSKLYIV